MSFRNQLATDMTTLSTTDEYGESITYYLHAGGSLTLNAIVTRNPPEKPGATPRLQSAGVIIDASKNLLTIKPVLDGDQVVIAGNSKRLTVVKLIDESDPGAWHFVVN